MLSTIRHQIEWWGEAYFLKTKQILLLGSILHTSLLHTAYFQTKFFTQLQGSPNSGCPEKLFARFQFEISPGRQFSFS